MDSEGSEFRDYGIEQNKIITENTGTYNVANHIRALLDLLAQESNRRFYTKGRYGLDDLLRFGQIFRRY
jgi:hypothetical protein